MAKLDKFGVLYFSNVRELNGGEMSIMSFISQQCSKSIDAYKNNPSVSPRFEKIPTQEFVVRCGMCRRLVFKIISGLIEKGFLLKIKKGKASYFPANKYFGVGKRHGMVQEDHMIKLTKNEKTVYNYLSTCQGNSENCNPSRRQIMVETGIKSIQMVSRILTGLVRKDVIKRVEVNKQSNIYYVKRITKDTIKSAQNVHTKSAQNVHTNEVKSAQNVHHILNNSLKEENNSVVNNPEIGKEQLNFLKNTKGNVVLLESFKKMGQQHAISFSEKSIRDYRILLMTYINTLSPTSIDYMNEQGCSLNSFINIHMNEYLKTGVDDYRVIPEDIQKISESEKKSLQEYVSRKESSIDDLDNNLLEEARRYLVYNFTLGSYARNKLIKVLSSIKTKKEKTIFKTDIERERKPW